MKRLIACTIMISILALVGCESAKSTSETGTGNNISNTYNTSDDMGRVYEGKIEIEGYGELGIELYPDIAPETVDNFVELANSGFYDDLTFHRIVANFMIQGGDPLGNGTGGSDTEIFGEFSNNGFDNTLSHTRGVISMARSYDPNSASSQFFIMHADGTYLDGDYAAFGKVITGMEIIDTICEDVQVEDENGTVLAENQPVITSIRVEVE